MKKKMVSMLMAVTMIATMVGCGNDEAVTEPKSEESEQEVQTEESESAFTGTIRMLNWKPESADAMKKVEETYKDETGIDIVIDTAPANEYESTLMARMTGSDMPSIFIVDSASMLSSWKDYAADLSGTELYSYVTDDAYTLNDGDGGVYGISYALEAWGLIVNKGITDAYFASPNKTTEYTSLDELDHFAALKAVVEDMTALKDELGIQGVFGSTSMASGEDWRWTSHLPNQPLYYEWGGNENINLSGEIPEFTFQYVQNFKNIFDLYLNNSVTDAKLVGSKSVNDSMAEFALGQCAMIQNGDWAWDAINSADGKVVKDEDVCFIPITTGVEGEEKMGLDVGCSQYLCINSQVSQEEQKAAADFLAWLFGSETGKKLVAEDLKFVTPFNTMADVTYSNPLFASENEIAASGKISYCWAIRLIPDQTWKDEFGANLLMYAQGQMEWDEVVAKAVESWETEREIVNAQ